MYPVVSSADCIILRFLGEKIRRGRAIISIWFCVLYGTDLPDPSGCVCMGRIWPLDQEKTPEVVAAGAVVSFVV